MHPCACVSTERARKFGLLAKCDTPLGSKKNPGPVATWAFMAGVVTSTRERLFNDQFINMYLPRWGSSAIRSPLGVKHLSLQWQIHIQSFSCLFAFTAWLQLRCVSLLSMLYLVLSSYFIIHFCELSMIHPQPSVISSPSIMVLPSSN